MSKWISLTVAAGTIAALGFAYWKMAIPAHRIEGRSTLVMLGDLDGDHRWTGSDLKRLDAFLADPFGKNAGLACSIDLNKNELIDEEDLRILRSLAEAGGDPYSAEEKASLRGDPFPRPRELYTYVPESEYRPSPLWALSYSFTPELAWLGDLFPAAGASHYMGALNAELFAEAVRFDQAWRKRAPALLPIERAYATRKLLRAKSLMEAGQRFELLLALIELVEDAETLTARDQSGFILGLLTLRDHLRETLDSPEDWRAKLGAVARHLQSDLGLTYNLETLERPRDLTHLENYLQRAEWQYYKSTTRETDFRALIGYAQRDRRYARAVSRTSRKLRDPSVENHNLPMVLLFREAMRIKGGDKKKAVGLLDEAIRIPYAWIKSLPSDVLPGSLALDNFLLPGNKEDGADKSRHWNVFGGVCLYKSPRESLDLALKREIQDLRAEDYSRDAMREFFRDMIANLNGMYHVMTVNPKLLD